MSEPQIINNLTWKNSKTFSPAEISQPQIIIIPKKFKDFFACKTVFAADHRCPGNIQTLFHLQTWLNRKSSTTWKNLKTFSPAEITQPQIIIIPKKFKAFFACKTVFAADHRCPGNIQTLFHLQICLSRKSSTTWKNLKTFSPAEISQPQIIIIPKKFKDFFACKTVFAADHRCPGNIQTLFHLQIWLNRKSSTTWKNSNTFLTAEFSQTQTINNLEIIKDFFACRTVLAADHRYPGIN